MYTLIPEIKPTIILILVGQVWKSCATLFSFTPMRMAWNLLRFDSKLQVMLSKWNRSRHTCGNPKTTKKEAA